MSRSVTIELPDHVNAVLRSHPIQFSTAKLPENVIIALFEKGVQRGANDPLGAQFGKGETPPADVIAKYATELQDRWDSGQVQKARTGGLGRTSNPIEREVKRLAAEEVNANVPALLDHHNITLKEFNENYRTKYVAARIEKHRDRLEKDAKANVAKLQKTAEVELLDI